MNPEQITTVILNVTFIAAFIAVFFFTYGKIIEENVVKKQSIFIADNLAKDLSTFIDKQTASDIISKLSIPNMEAADKKAKEINENLQKDATKIVIWGTIIGLVIAFLVSNYYNLEFFKLLKNNLIILFFVGITYYLFLTYFGQNFISADPNFVRVKILNIIKTKLQSDIQFPQIPNITLADAQQLASKANELGLQIPAQIQQKTQSQELLLQTPNEIPQLSDFLI